MFGETLDKEKFPFITRGRQLTADEASQLSKFEDSSGQVPKAWVLHDAITNQATFRKTQQLERDIRQLKESCKRLEMAQRKDKKIIHDLWKMMKDLHTSQGLPSTSLATNSSDRSNWAEPAPLMEKVRTFHHPYLSPV